MGQFGDLADRQARPGGPRDVRERDEPRPGHDGPVHGLQDRRRIGAGAEVRDLQPRPKPLADRPQPAEAAGVFEVRRHDPIAGFPVDRPGRHVHPVRGRVREGNMARVRPDDAGDRGPRLGPPLQSVPPEVGVGAAGP